MNQSVWWEYMVAAAFGGAAMAIVLRRLIPAVAAWLTMRIMPARHLKPCGERRRKH